MAVKNILVMAVSKQTNLKSYNTSFLQKTHQQIPPYQSRHHRQRHRVRILPQSGDQSQSGGKKTEELHFNNHLFLICVSLHIFFMNIICYSKNNTFYFNILICCIKVSIFHCNIVGSGNKGIGFQLHIES